MRSGYGKRVSTLVDFLKTEIQIQRVTRTGFEKTPPSGGLKQDAPTELRQDTWNGTLLRQERIFK
jgi:hypothetical protein